MTRSMTHRLAAAGGGAAAAAEAEAAPGMRATGSRTAGQKLTNTTLRWRSCNLVEAQSV
jgi:hypothetical protein